MGKNKKSATKVAAAPAVVAVAQPARKGKRGVENKLSKAVSAKKQKVERDETVVAKQKVEKKLPIKAAGSSDDDSDALGSDSDISDDKPVAKNAPVVVKNGSAVVNKDSTSDASEGSEASDSDSEDEHDDEEKVANILPAELNGFSDSGEGSSDEDDEASDEDESDEEENEKQSPKTPKKPKTPAISEATGSKTLFVANLAYSVKESDVRAFFEDVGEVVDVRLASNAEGQFRGFGHVDFATAEAAQKALELNEQSLLDRPVRLDLARAKGDVKTVDAASTFQKTPKTPATSEATASKTLFVANLAFSVTESDVRAFFEDIGEVVDIRLASNAEGEFRGFGHVDFATAEAAQKAMELHEQPLLDRPVRLELAREKGDRSANNRENNSFQKGGKGQVQTAFVKGFDTSLGEDEIRSALQEHFGSCGEITRVSIPPDFESGGVKGMAYMDFSDSNGFKAALGMDGSDLGGGFCLNVQEAKPKGDSAGGGRFGGGRSGGRSGGRGGGGRFSGRGGRDGGRFSGRGGGRGRGRGRY